MYMNRLLRDQWVDALLSGQYRQGNDIYDPETRSFCVTSVLLDVLAHTHPTTVWWNPEENTWMSLFVPGEDEEMYLHGAIVNLLHEMNVIGGDMDTWKKFMKDTIAMNDTKYTFAFLAAWIDWWVRPMDTV